MTFGVFGQKKGVNSPMGSWEQACLVSTLVPHVAEFGNQLSQCKCLKMAVC